MPRPKEVSIEDDSLDSHTPATDEEAIVPQQLQSFKKTEYGTLHLSPEKSALKVLWERVSAEITRRTSNNVQSAPRAINTEEYKTGQQLTESDLDLSSTTYARASAQVILDGVTTVIDQNSAIKIQDTTLDVDNREKEGAEEVGNEKRNLSIDAPYYAHHGPQDHVAEEAVRSKTQDTTLDAEYREEKGEEEVGDEKRNLSLDTPYYAHHGPQDHVAVEAVRSKTQDTALDTDYREEEGEEELGNKKRILSLDTPYYAHHGPQDHVAEEAVSAKTQDTALDTDNREEEGEEEFGNKKRNLSLDTPYYAHHGSPDHVAEEAVSTKIQNTTIDFVPRGGQEDQESVEECVTTYESPIRERLRQLEEDVPLDGVPENLPNENPVTFETEEIPCPLSGYGVERDVFIEEMERKTYSPFIMDSQQTQLSIEELQDDVQPLHLLHEDVSTSKTVESLSQISETEGKRDDSGEEDVPYLSYNPPENFERQQLQKHLWHKVDIHETTHEVTAASKTEALRKELEALEGSDDEEDTSLSEDEPLKPTTYVMPDPVRAHLDDEVLLYHVPRSPEAPRRYSEKAFIRFK